MSICLHVEADDAGVEAILTYLETNCKLPIGDQIFLLERTLKWLRPAAELRRVNLDPQDQMPQQLPLVSVVPADRLPQPYFETEPVFPADRR